MVIPFLPFGEAIKLISVFEWNKEYVGANSCKQSRELAAPGIVANFSPLYTSKGSVSMQSVQVYPVTWKYILMGSLVS